jgi:enoyl-CoA hydratase/carnithine racemase
MIWSGGESLGADNRILLTDDSEGVRVLTLNRPGVKNAMNADLWEATTVAFAEAAKDPSVSTLVLAGAGGNFSSGQDMKEMLPGNVARGRGGFRELAAEMARFPKPFLCAIDGIGVGFGATVIGLADLVFMSETARIKCPFTSIGLVPEFGSSYTFARLAGRQNAIWALLSSQWLSAAECFEMGFAFKLCPPDELMDVTVAHARILAAQPVESLVASKRLIIDSLDDPISDALTRESIVLLQMLGGPANSRAVARFLGR